MNYHHSDLAREFDERHDYGTSHPVGPPASASGASSGVLSASNGLEGSNGARLQQAGSVPPLTSQGTFRSLEWMHRLRDAEIAPQLKQLGFAMMSYANAEGKMFPTLAQLALLTPADEEGGTVSEKTVQRRRGKLLRLGWVRCVEKGNGRGRASVYRLSFPDVNADTGQSETRTETRTPPLPETRTGLSDQERYQVKPSSRGKEGKERPVNQANVSDSSVNVSDSSVNTFTEPRIMSAAEFAARYADHPSPSSLTADSPEEWA